MPYSKEQLKNNEYYERVVEAARREQISLYARQDLDSAASGSNTAANPNVRLKTEKIRLNVLKKLNLHLKFANL